MDKNIFSKAMDFVQYANDNGHDITKMAFDKAYMKRVVDEYYKRKGENNNDSCGNNAG